MRVTLRKQAALWNEELVVNIRWNRIWNEDQGVLTFEWILLITVLVIGIVGGLSATRDAIIDELGDVAEAVVRIDQSYNVAASPCPGETPLGNEFGFTDTLPEPLQEGSSCDFRQRGTLTGQTLGDCDSSP